MTGGPPAAGRDWTGGEVRDGAWCVLAGNPGPMTLDGTNTWLVHAPGDDQAVVIDPGPDDEEHLRNVLELAGRRGLRITSALLSHGHPDHSEGARHLAELAGCELRAAGPAFSTGTPLRDGDVIEAGELRVQVIATPGHSSDSVCFLVPALRVLLTGDTVLGRGTSVVAHPDGQLGPYLTSLARLRELSETTAAELIMPGHGPVIDEPLLAIDGYLSHRRARLDQVRAAVAGGARSARDVVERVYPDIEEKLRPAAELSAEAQLAYLAEQEGEREGGSRSGRLAGG